MTKWTKILTASEIEAQYNLTASIDLRFANDQRDFYASRTVNELNALAQQAWNCNEPTAYQLARSYAALRA